MGKLNFRVGEDLPILLWNIAQEKLIYQHDIKGAIETFITSLGMSEEIALKCLSGKDYILCTDSFGDVILKPRTEDCDSNYPMLDSEGLRSKWITELLEDVQHYQLVFNRFDNFSWDRSLNLRVDFDIKTLIDIFLQHPDSAKDIMYSKIINIFDDREDEFLDGVASISLIIDSFKSWVVDLFNKVNVLEFLEINNLIVSNTESTKNINKILKRSVLIYNNILILLNKINYIVEINTFETKILNLFKRNPITANFINCNILPVDIESNYDAGWLSPEGDFYGMNGEYNDMLHNKISDLLYKDGIIPNNEMNEITKDYWLEKNGWVKIHKGWILFECEETSYSPDLTLIKKVSRHLTQEQVKMLCTYGKTCNNGFLKVGYKQTPISIYLFESMDEIARTNLFRL